MVILLANPPTFQRKGSFNRPVRFPTFNYATPVMHPPLYLAYAASYLRAKGHEVHLIDAPVLAMSVEDFAEKVLDIAPDFIVFETSTPSFSNDGSVVQFLRKRNVEAKFVFMGTHVSACPVKSVERAPVDAVVVGEYEISLSCYVEDGPEGTEGVCYRNRDGRIVLNDTRKAIPNLDILPFPARDLLPNRRYFDPILKNPFTFVLAGRGCPYRCIFCNWPQVLTGRKYRLRSVDNVLDELETLRNSGFRSILFNDDTFTANRKNVMQLCRGMEERNLKIKWACYARADDKDEELLDTMKEAGCYLLKVGIESGVQEILDESKKGYKLEDIKPGVKLMLKKGFHVHGTFAFGLPGENKATIEKTIRFAKDVNPTTVQFSVAVPYPGTEFYDYLNRNGRLLTDNWDEFMPLRPIYQYDGLRADELISSVGRAYRIYYFRPKYVPIAFKKLFTAPMILLGSLLKLLKLVFRP